MLLPTRQILPTLLQTTLVQPLRETDFGDPARYHEAMAESAEVLRVVERRGGAGSEEQGWE